LSIPIFRGVLIRAAALIGIVALIPAAAWIHAAAMACVAAPACLAAAVAGPGERDRQRQDGADGAAHGDDPCRGHVLRRGPRGDHDRSLTEAHPALGQAEGLAKRPGRRAKNNRTAQLPTASGPMNRSLVAGTTNRLKTIAPTVSPSALAARMTPTASAPPPRPAASGVTTPS